VTDHRYDGVGRPIENVVQVPGAGRFATERWYDGAGRLGGIRYPVVQGQPRFSIAYKYSAYAGGVVVGVEDGTGRRLWTAEDHSPFGAIAQESFGNSFRVARGLDPATAFLRTLKGGFVSDAPGLERASGEAPGIPVGLALEQDLTFDYFSDGFPKSRKDLSMTSEAEVNEEYQYDDLDRLERWIVGTSAGRTQFKYGFDGAERFLGRTVEEGNGVAWGIEHGLAQPHAPSQSTIGTDVRSYEYDAMGRRLRDGNRTITYTSFDLPRTVTEGDRVTRFEYDAFGTRVRKSGGGAEAITVGGIYERRQSSTHVFRVPGADRVIAEVEWSVIGNSVAENVRYLHDTQLGTVELVTGKATGSVVGRQRLEPYGGTVDPANPAIALNPGLVPGLKYGLTGHQHDDDLGYVNMGGRIYDPRSGAFVSPDPLIADPVLLSSYDPYAYVRNNPVALVDPSGYAPQDGCDCRWNHYTPPPSVGPPTPPRGPGFDGPIGWSAGSDFGASSGVVGRQLNAAPALDTGAVVSTPSTPGSAAAEHDGHVSPPAPQSAGAAIVAADDARRESLGTTAAVRGTVVEARGQAMALINEPPMMPGRPSLGNSGQGGNPYPGATEFKNVEEAGRTMAAAAFEATRRYSGNSRKRSEYGALIFRVGDRVFATALVPGRSIDEGGAYVEPADLAGALPKGPGISVAGLVHSHPSLPGFRGPDDPDVRSAITLKERSGRMFFGRRLNFEASFIAGPQYSREMAPMQISVYRPKAGDRRRDFEDLDIQRY
jgi:RHS repeat-associated protein